jgi:ribose transport system permease protein
MKRIIKLIGGDKLVLCLAIVAVAVFFTSINANYFSFVNFSNILVASSLVGLVAIGETYLIIAAQVDLSPGAIAGFSGVFSALLVSMHVPLALTIIITLVIGGLIGFLNSVMINKLALEAFIATLVAQSAIRGFAYIICNGNPVAINDPTFISLDRKSVV